MKDAPPVSLENNALEVVLWCGRLVVFLIQVNLSIVLFAFYYTLYVLLSVNVGIPPMMHPFSLVGCGRTSSKGNFMMWRRLIIVLGVRFLFVFLYFRHQKAMFASV